MSGPCFKPHPFFCNHVVKVIVEGHKKKKKRHMDDQLWRERELTTYVLMVPTVMAGGARVNTWTQSFTLRFTPVVGPE